MKKIYITLFIACLYFASCEDYEGKGQGLFFFTPNEYTFDKNGGETTLILENPKFRNWYITETTIAPWENPYNPPSELSTEERKELILEAEKDKSWYKITKLDNGDMHVEVGKNDKSYIRTLVIHLERLDGPVPSWALIYIRQTK